MKYVRKTGIVIALIVMCTVVVTSGYILSGCAARTTADASTAPRVEDFVKNSFLCTGEFSPMTNNRVAEFSGTWLRNGIAEIKIVEFVDGVETDNITNKLVARVDSYGYGRNIVAVGDRQFGENSPENVVLRVEGIKPTQEFGIAARWWPNGDFALLAKWRGDEQNKCGDPLAQYGQPS